MSRMQNILEKAEREGALRSVRVMAEPAATARSFEPPTIVPPPAMDGFAAVGAAPEPVAVPAARTVRDPQLDPTLVAALKPSAAAAEQYRALRTRLAHADHGTPIDVILVTSPGRGEGKSLTAANLALTMAQESQTRVCLVDANLRHSRLHTLFAVTDTPGLADVLTGQASLADALIAFEPQQITLLPAGHGPWHPAELLGSTAMRRTIQALRTQFDRIIIDAPEAGPLADVGILAPLVDSVLLVVQAGVTTKPAIHEAVSTLSTGKLLGVVLNSAAA